MGYPCFHLHFTGALELWSREMRGCSVLRSLSTPPYPEVLPSRAQPLKDWHLLGLYLIC